MHLHFLQYLDASNDGNMEKSGKSKKKNQGKTFFFFLAKQSRKNLQGHNLFIAVLIFFCDGSHIFL